MVAFNLFEYLACPIHRTSLKRTNNSLHCESGCRYPVFNKIPFLLSPDIDQTNDAMSQESFALAKQLQRGAAENWPSVYSKSAIDPPPPRGSKNDIDPHVQEYVAHTNSLLYKSLIGKLGRYPIPEFPMQPRSASAILLDIGCGWGRWCFAAARRGFIPVGIDPSLSHCLAAQRVAKQLGIEAYFAVADSRYLPFLPSTFDAAFSFSVLQHLSHKNVELTVQSLAPLMKPDGTSMLHILNWLGLRSLQVQIRRGFRDGPDQFDTRYWSVPKAVRIFASKLGSSHVEVDGFFVQARYEDRKMLTVGNRVVLEISHALTRLSHVVPLLSRFADNVYIVSKKQPIPT
jgi:2-polyprenyl-3-methyl-5-hydroxy-6-metoxy-1,4-benzoquinol methylase/uncharacterized protein YbaR (Trm112 family)